MARSTFRSQNVQNTPCSDHFWKFRCRKSARRCGAKHISKTKCANYIIVGPSCDVEKVHAVVARSTCRSQNVQNTPCTDHFWRFRSRSAWQAQGIVDLVKSEQNVRVLWHFQLLPLHYTTLPYITLHYNYNYTSLHSTTLHSTPLHCIQLHSITLHYITLHSTTLHYTTLHYITLHYTTFHYTTLRYIPLHYTSPTPTTTLHYTKLRYTTLHYITLHYTPRHSTTLQYITLAPKNYFQK